VQAPQRRKEEREAPDRRTLLLALAALAAAAAIGAAAYILLRGDDGGATSVRAAMEAAGCTFRTAPALEGTHIADPDATPEEWNTNPPTTGPHFGTPAIWGEYDEPIQLARAVHNLEHGGIGMYYGEEVADAAVESLRRFYRDDPTAMLLAPLPRLGDKIALTAWYAPLQEEGEEGEPAGVVAECTRFDEDAFETFRDTYRFKGPERFPPEALEPGM